MNATEQLAAWIQESSRIVFSEGPGLQRKAGFPTSARLRVCIRRSSIRLIHRKSY